MGEQKVENSLVESEHTGPEMALSQSGFSAAGSSAASPPPFQLSADFQADNSVSNIGVRSAPEVPLQLFGDGVNRIVGSSDADLAAAQQENQPEGWNSEITSVTTVDLEAIEHQGLTRAVGDTGEARVQNLPGDVVNIQRLLVMHSVLNAGQVSTIADLQAQEEEEHIPADTLAGIRTFQTTLQEQGVIREVDGVVDPGGTTFRQLRSDPEQRDEPVARGDREELTDEAENFAIETEFEDELEGLEGDQRAYMLEMLSIYIGSNRDARAASDAEGDALTVVGNQAGFDRLAAHISNNTDPGGANGDRSLVGSATIMTFLTEIGYWADFPRRASAAAETEFAIWTGEDGGQRTEGEELELLERLRAYTYSGNAGVGNAQSAADDTWPWSAVFISHVMHQAGAGDTFNYSASHSQYAGAAYQNTVRTEEEREGSNEISNMFPADPDIANIGDVAEPVQVGDLIHFMRGGADVRLTGNNIAPALARRRAFLSHSDLVTSIEIYAPTYNPEANPTGHLPYSAETLALVQAANADYTIFALTIGGNTSDYDIPEGEAGAGAEGVRNNSNTAGLKYWPLNDDMTLQVRNAPGNVMPYGVMRLGESIAPAPAAADPAAAPDAAGPGGPGQPPVPERN